MAAGTQIHRSLASAIALALQAAWDDVEGNPADYRSNLSAYERSPLGRRADGPSVGGAVGLFAELRFSHAVEWRLPVDLLGRLLSATFNGLVLSYLATGDSAGCRGVLDLLADDLARHGVQARVHQSSN